MLYITTEEENGHCLFLVFGCVVCSTITTLLLIKFKNWEWTDTETSVSITTIIFVVVWLISGSSLLGLILAVVAQLVAGWPLMKESWMKPGSGMTLISYIIFVIVYALAIIESPDWDPKNVIFPIAFLIYTIGDTFPLLRKWLRIKKRKASLDLSIHISKSI